MTDITMGQYYPADSFLHRLDPRMKIALSIFSMVTIFLCNSFPALGLMAAFTLLVCALSRVPAKTIIKGIKPIIFIVIFTALLNLFYGPGEPIIKWWIFKITENGIYTAIVVSVRIICLVLFGTMLTYTTTPTALTDAIEALLKPLKLLHVDVHSFAMIMTIALRFIPTLLEEVDKIMAAQKSRGADMENGSIIKRIKAVVPVIIPLFVSSFRRANELAYAMECRCYRGGDGRTKMNVMTLKSRDYAVMAVVLIYIATIIGFRFVFKSVM